MAGIGIQSALRYTDTRESVKVLKARFLDQSHARSEKPLPIPQVVIISMRLKICKLKLHFPTPSKNARHLSDRLRRPFQITRELM